MPKTIDATRRARFLITLRETGNQTLSAERAKVSRSWVRLARSADPAFDTAVREALAQAAALDRRGPAFGRNGYFEGRELVQRGVGGRRIQVARARPREWSAVAETRFIAVLCATCSVFAACATVGLSPSSAYRRRRAHPDFAARWADALASGADRLEMALLEAACHDLGDTRDPEILPDLVFDRPIRTSEAIAFLRKHRNTEARRERAEWRAKIKGVRLE